MRRHSSPALLPSAQKPATQWADVFRRIGFFRCTQVFATIAGQSRMLRLVSFADSRPREATMIFRICDPERARHVSWTPNLGKALEYAPGGENSLLVAHPDAHLYSVIVEPVHVLAVLNDFEWIIDPTDVEITDHGTRLDTIMMNAEQDKAIRAAVTEAMSTLTLAEIRELVREPYREFAPVAVAVSAA